MIRQPLSISRIMVPGTNFIPTPAHQDFIHIQGTKNVWTAWFPLGDCPRELGGLTVLVGSQADGLLTYHASTGRGRAGGVHLPVRLSVGHRRLPGR